MRIPLLYRSTRAWWLQRLWAVVILACLVGWGVVGVHGDEAQGGTGKDIYDIPRTVLDYEVCPEACFSRRLPKCELTRRWSCSMVQNVMFPYFFFIALPHLCLAAQAVMQLLKMREYGFELSVKVVGNILPLLFGIFALIYHIVSGFGFLIPSETGTEVRMISEIALAISNTIFFGEMLHVILLWQWLMRVSRGSSSSDQWLLKRRIILFVMIICFGTVELAFRIFRAISGATPAVVLIYVVLTIIWTSYVGIVILKRGLSVYRAGDYGRRARAATSVTKRVEYTAELTLVVVYGATGVVISIVVNLLYGGLLTLGNYYAPLLQVFYWFVLDMIKLCVVWLQLYTLRPLPHEAPADHPDNPALRARRTLASVNAANTQISDDQSNGANANTLPGPGPGGASPSTTQSKLRRPGARMVGALAVGQTGPSPAPVPNPTITITSADDSDTNNKTSLAPPNTSAGSKEAPSRRRVTVMAPADDESEGDDDSIGASGARAVTRERTIDPADVNVSANGTMRDIDNSIMNHHSNHDPDDNNNITNDDHHNNDDDGITTAVVSSAVLAVPGDSGSDSDQSRAEYIDDWASRPPPPLASVFDGSDDDDDDGGDGGDRSVQDGD